MFSRAECSSIAKDPRLIGNQLARLEGQIALLNLVQRFPQMKLAGPRPEWAPTFGFRGLKSLSVIL
jgi:cytochrome P450